MQVTPEVIFKNVRRSGWIERYVAERLQHLERFSTHITRCHVTLAREQSSHRKGNHYSAMVEVRLPRQHDLAAKKQREVHDPRVELPAVIHEAFAAIERQVKKIEAARGGGEKAHAARRHRDAEQRVV